MKFPEPNPIFDKPKQTKPQLNNIKLFKFYFFTNLQDHPIHQFQREKRDLALPVY
jgi:hypothetical protein